MTRSKPSRRAVQRHAAELAGLTATPIPLGVELREMLDRYRLPGVDAATWAAIQPVLHDVMSRSQVVGVASFRKHIGVVAAYLAWRHAQTLSIAVADAFTTVAVDQYYLHGIDGSDRTRNEYRSRLQRLAVKVNPALGAPIEVPTNGHQDVRPGYTDIEMAQIRRCAQRQRSARTGQQLCAIVGLCAGAGLSATDLRHLRGSHIRDHGDDGIEVEVTGDRPRVVWVRRDYEQIVRLGTVGVRPTALVVGTKQARKNVTTAVIAGAELYDAPNLDASRLRSTWLTWLMNRRTPLPVILDAAGLKTARSLTDLLKHLPSVDADPQTELRGEAP